MPRQQTEVAEELCVGHFLGWYNPKFHTLYKWHGRSREIYRSKLHGKKDWDWVCRDASNNNREMAVEVLSITFEEPAKKMGAAYNIFLKAKDCLDYRLPCNCFRWVPHVLTARQVTKKEQQIITGQLVSKIKEKLIELSILPDGGRLDLSVGDNTFTLERWSPKSSPSGCKLLGPHMATAFNADPDEIKKLLREKIPDKNDQLKIPHEWGFLTVLLLQSSGAPHWTAIKSMVNCINEGHKSNIDRIFIVQTPRFEVFEVNSRFSIT